MNLPRVKSQASPSWDRRPRHHRQLEKHNLSRRWGRWGTACGDPQPTLLEVPSSPTGAVGHPLFPSPQPTPLNPGSEVPSLTAPPPQAGHRTSPGRRGSMGGGLQTLKGGAVLSFPPPTPCFHQNCSVHPGCSLPSHAGSSLASSHPGGCSRSSTLLWKSSHTAPLHSCLR